jgi:hypothetical protein
MQSGTFADSMVCKACTKVSGFTLVGTLFLSLYSFIEVRSSARHRWYGVIFHGVRRYALDAGATPQRTPRDNPCVVPNPHDDDTLSVWFCCWCYIMGYHIPSGCVSFFSSSGISRVVRPDTTYFSVKTKVQQRALAGIPPRGIFETFRRMLRGSDPNSPKPLLVGLTRLYQGLGMFQQPYRITRRLKCWFVQVSVHFEVSSRMGCYGRSLTGSGTTLTTYSQIVIFIDCPCQSP